MEDIHAEGNLERHKGAGPKKRQLKVASGCRFALDVIVHHHPAGQLPLADQEPVICDLGPAAWC